ncbi:WXG100 family type VII secretion target [Streptomyces sp. NPDC093094]|uniref:WXG100 family type VII secretion target n=1 Tax=Streptomyces sp. NPDC093094 TaxID=3366026 RepID=UPI00382E994A
MANPEVQELTERAAKLRSLAEHIEKLTDSPHTFSTVTMKNWSGPHADRIRGDLRNWRTKCGSVAEALRDEATACDKSAKDLRNPKP